MTEDKSRTFQIPYSFKMKGLYSVQAKDLEEAIAKMYNDLESVFDNSEYSNNSLKIDIITTKFNKDNA